MRNPILRAEQMFQDGDIFAPEYANNKLAVTITFCPPLTDTKEVAIYIYVEDGCFMGTDVQLMPSGKKIRKLTFEVCTDRWWESGNYRVFVMRNGLPRWSATMRISPFSCVTARCELKDDLDFLLPPREEPLTEDYFLTDERVDDDDWSSADTEDDFDKRLERFIADEMATGSPKVEKTDNSQSAEKRLQEMVGLSRVKEEINEASMLALFNKKRCELGLDDSVENRHHMLFLGNPGTGKTTVAKLIGELYHQMGLLSEGHTVVVERAMLVGKYVGHTEDKVSEFLDKAKGGVLFIDEAYTLIHSHQDTNDFGPEVINTLLTKLSEPNPDMIIILAGYEDKMEELMRFNPGLRERFPIQLHFDDYSPEELLEMAHRLCRSRHFQLTPEADSRLAQLIEKVCATRDCYFGNGRWVHNLMDHGIIKHMAHRVMSGLYRSDDKQLFSCIEEEDVIAAEPAFLNKKPLTILPPRRIGFATATA